MKIALAQQNYHIANFEYNIRKIEQAALEAAAVGCELIVFSELSLCGYPPRDFLQHQDFITRCYQSIARLKPLSKKIAMLVGSPERNPSKEGKDLFNAACFLYDGESRFVYRKSLLPTYDVFDEDRHFEQGNIFDVLHFKGKKIAVTICEDIWNIDNTNPLYTFSPMDKIMQHKPDFIVNLSASPFDYYHAAERKKQVRANALRYQLPVFYANAVGTQTEITFDGGSCVYDQKGNLLDEFSYFSEEVRTYEFAPHEIRKCDSIPLTVSAAYTTSAYEKIPLMYGALVYGIHNYFGKMHFKKAILGLSGGIDSALTLVLACAALGKQNVLPVLLPSPYSSAHSVDDSLQLCNNLGIQYKQIPIEASYNALLKTVEPHFENKPFNVAEENIQARCRAIILMALANKHNYILLNTTNKSEAAVGYGTLYGDMCGGLSVLADVYKTDVYRLCAYINQKAHESKDVMNESLFSGPGIPQHILTKAPSAELRPNQKDSDSLPGYDFLDEILYRYIEQRKSASNIIADGFDAATVQRVLKMVNSNEWKRHQMPPVLRVSPKAFGVGRRMPIVAQYD